MATQFLKKIRAYDCATTTLAPVMHAKDSDEITACLDDRNDDGPATYCLCSMHPQSHAAEC